MATTGIPAKKCETPQKLLESCQTLNSEGFFRICKKTMQALNPFSSFRPVASTCLNITNQTSSALPKTSQNPDDNTPAHSLPIIGDRLLPTPPDAPLHSGDYAQNYASPTLGDHRTDRAGQVERVNGQELRP
jgi:hypothetical protein